MMILISIPYPGSQRKALDCRATLDERCVGLSFIQGAGGRKCSGLPAGISAIGDVDVVLGADLPERLQGARAVYDQGRFQCGLPALGLLRCESVSPVDGKRTRRSRELVDCCTSQRHDASFGLPTVVDYLVLTARGFFEITSLWYHRQLRHHCQTEIKDKRSPETFRGYRNTLRIPKR